MEGLPETETPIRTLTEKVDGMEESDDKHENEYGKEGNESMLFTNMEIWIRIIGFEEGGEIVTEGGGDRESRMNYCRFRGK